MSTPVTPVFQHNCRVLRQIIGAIPPDAYAVLGQFTQYQL